MQCIQFHRTLQDEGIKELCADLRAQLPPKGCWHAQLRSLVRFFLKTEKRLRGTSLEESPPAESLKAYAPSRINKLLGRDPSFDGRP